MIDTNTEVRREAGRKILVVDDEQIILDLLSRVLSREGYQVTTARRANDAVNVVSADSYDLAIADVDLRRSDGYELMSLIGETSPHTALVVMTGNPEERVVRYARDHAQGLLSKPFALEQLLAVVSGALRERAKDTPQADVASSLSRCVHAGMTA